MNDDGKPSLTEAIRLLAERDRRSLGAHPKLEELAAYQAGELEPQATARLREHIAVCRECSDLLLDLINFSDLAPPPGEPGLTDDEMEQDWQALRARMAESGAREEPRKPAEVVPIRPAAPAPAPPPPPGRSLWLPVAASLLAVLGFSFGLYQSLQVGKLRDRIKADEQPSVEDTFSLQDSTVRGGSEEEPARMSASKGGTILLSPPEVGPGQVEILHGEDVLWSTGIKGDLVDVPIDIPGGFLEPGSYTVRVYGKQGGTGAPDREYTLEVDDP